MNELKTFVKDYDVGVKICLEKGESHTMQICSDEHKPIRFDEAKCPLCALKQAMTVIISAYESAYEREITILQTKLNASNNEVSKLEAIIFNYMFMLK